MKQTFEEPLRFRAKSTARSRREILISRVTFRCFLLGIGEWQDFRRIQRIKVDMFVTDTAHETVIKLSPLNRQDGSVRSSAVVGDLWFGITRMDASAHPKI